MEKFSQFRDRATGIAPFLPIVENPLSALFILTRLPIFLFKLFLFTLYYSLYFLLITWLPLPSFARKMALWVLLFIPGIAWIDLQLDGVKRGTLANQPRDRVPHPGSVIAANFTSPIDALYLAAVFDPIFTISYPGCRMVERVGLLGAITKALGPVYTTAPPTAKLISISALMAQNPNRIVVVFPECGTTNGKAILPLSPSILQTPAETKIFPVSIRYTPSDITTPVPGTWLRFLWNILSRLSTGVRVRVGEAQFNLARAKTDGVSESEAGGALSEAGQKVLNRLSETLARLGRVKKVGLTMNDKANFVNALNGKRR